MGVLDDAIREHIELKRQHGASEPDLKRQEQEALGPARRESPAPPEDRIEEPASAAPVEDLEVAPTEIVALDVEPEPTDEPAAFVDAEPHTLEDPSVEPPAPDGPPLEPGFLADEEPFAEPAPWAASSSSVPEDDEDEDVLEETPEFLQETPEHDRLWFEQKPPRDFDFDE